MKVGIYNRWLATLGGGEKYSLAIAEFLARQHSVQVISHQPVSKTLAAERLDLDLSRVEFITVPDRPTIDLVSITPEYDFFINASFLDMFPSAAKQSALVVYFPFPLSVEKTKWLYRWGGLILKKLLMVPSFMGVLENRSYHHSQLRRVGPRLKIEMPVSRFPYRIHFDIASQDPQTHQALFSLDGHEIELVDLPTDQSFVRFNCVIPPATHDAPRELSIQARLGARVPTVSPIKLAVTHFEIEHPRYRVYQILFERWLRNWGLRLHRTPYRSSPILDCVDTYDAIWAISDFTKRWIEHYWHRSSAVLYPSVDVEKYRPEQKQNQILSVGRFFEGSHNKKHDVMIAAFKRMVDQGLKDWTLHLVGGVGPTDADAKYMASLLQAAPGYPISIHTDLGFADLIRLYGESAIYWHASGYGEDETQEPIKFEHFGITTVEAMASGCVPVVIGKGGQPEIVKHAQNGFLWQTSDELIDLTWRLVKDISLRENLALAAVVDSRQYDKPHFEARAHALLDCMGSINK